MQFELPCRRRRDRAAGIALGGYAAAASTCGPLGGSTLLRRQLHDELGELIVSGAGATDACLGAGESRRMLPRQ